MEMESSGRPVCSYSYFVTLGIWVEFMLKINSRPLTSQGNVGVQTYDTLFMEKGQTVWRLTSHFMEMQGLQKSLMTDASIKLCHGFLQMIFEWKYLASPVIGIKTLCAELAFNFFKRLSKSPNT